MRKLMTIILICALSPASAVLGQNIALRGRVTLQVEIEARPISRIDTDVLAIPVFSGEDPLVTIIRGAGAELSQALRVASTQGALSGQLYVSTSFFSPPGFATRRIMFIGAGAENELSGERLRRLAGVAVRQVRSQHVSSMAFLARGPLAAEVSARAITEGAVLGLFNAGLHKTQARPSALKSFRLAGLQGSVAELNVTIERASVMAHATNFARSLVTEPANYMTPELMASHARAIAREGNLEVEIFDEKRMAELGMGAVLAVGKGSVNPPRFIVLRYRPAQVSPITLALVGKGVCFDSGGISIKPGANMHRMKGDMAGGAAVLGAMQVIARLRPAISILGIVPAVENMPDANAQKPGDVFTNYSGKSVEVLNTDAEGRLILSDGISYALKQDATHIVDVATLTGSIRTALGDYHTGAFASDDAFFEMLRVASGRTGENFWRMPIDEEYAREIKSSLVADLSETGGMAGASVGAKFIQQFTEGKPWIHLDIAGTSWPEAALPHMDAGPTGVTVRTLAELALTMGKQ